MDDPRWVATLLEHWEVGQQMGAVGPGSVRRQFDHATALAAQVAPPRRAVDLGSGAGVPGLALAGHWSDSSWVLIDASARRVRLLSQAIRALNWGDRVRALHARAEDAARHPDLRGSADLVVSRSFGPPAVTAECGVGFLSSEGLLVVTEPPDEGADRWPADGLALLGLEVVAGPDAEPVRIQRL